MEAKYVPFKKAIAKTLILGMLFSSIPKISSGQVRPRVDFGQDQTSVGVQYSMRFGEDSKSDYSKRQEIKYNGKIEDSSITNIRFKDVDKDLTERKLDRKHFAPVTGFEKSVIGWEDPYTSNLSKFVLGLTSPVQLYHHGSDNSFQFYPFMFSPFKVGGILSPFTKTAWKRKNLAKTAGTIFSEIGLVVAGILSSVKRSQNNSYTPPASEEQTPPENGGGDDDGGGGGEGGDL